MFLRCARRIPSLALTLISLRKSFSSEDRPLLRTTLTSVWTAETWFANMSVPATSFSLSLSHGIVCFLCVLWDGNMPGAVANVVCKTETSMLSCKSLLDVLRVGGGARVNRLESFCQLRTIVTQHTRMKKILLCNNCFFLIFKDTMSISFAALCMYMEVCTIPYARSGSLRVR